MQATVDLDRELIAVAGESTVYGQLSLVAPELSTDALRRPLNIGVVLDRSGSMQGEKLRHALASVDLLIDHLTARDWLTVVVFDDEAETLIHPTQVRDPAALKRAVSGVSAGSSTNLSAGWLLAGSQVRRVSDPEQIVRILLLTDGQANAGIQKKEDLVRCAARFLEERIELSTLGYGEGFNEDLLQALSIAGQGSFYYIANPDHAPRAFEHEVGLMAELVAQNVRVICRPEALVHRVHMLGELPVREGPDGVEALLGSLRANDERFVVFKLEVPALASVGIAHLATLDLEYDLVENFQHCSRRFDIEVTLVASSEAASVEPRLKVLERVALLEAARVRREAIERADRGDYEGARQSLESFRARHAGLASRSQEVDRELRRLEQEQVGLTNPQTYPSSRKFSSEMAYYGGRTIQMWGPRDDDALPPTGFRPPPHHDPGPGSPEAPDSPEVPDSPEPLDPPDPGDPGDPGVPGDPGPRDPDPGP